MNAGGRCDVAGVTDEPWAVLASQFSDEFIFKDLCRCAMKKGKLLTLGAAVLVLALLGGCRQRISDKLFPVLVGRKVGFINKEGKLIITPQFDLAGSFFEGLAPVKIGNKWGYIDKEGKYVINPQFDDAGYFFEGLARVRIGDKWGYIDKEGKYVWNPSD